MTTSLLFVITLLSLHEREKDVTQKKNKSVSSIWRTKTKSRGTKRTISCQGHPVPTVRINPRFPHTVTDTHTKQGKDTGLQFGDQFLLFSLSSYSSHQLCSLEPLVNWESWRQKQTSDSEEKVWGLINVTVILSLLPIS